MIFYCSGCWQELPRDTRVCPSCGVDVESLSLERGYVEKLVAALDHPEPTTPVRAAWILGIRKERCAVPRLIRIVRESQDPYLAEVAVEALAKIGDPDGLEAIRFAATYGAMRVRDRAQRTMEEIQRATSPAGPRISRALEAEDSC
jgi:HEAT repeat protein